MSDPYGSHEPILRALAGLSPQQVLETGSGAYSTRLLLDSDVFPTVRRVVSIETDPTWAAAARNLGDDRHQLVLCENVSELLPLLDLRPYGLIFIDDSESLHDRAASIRAIAQCAPFGVPVVVHDFEQPAYQAAAQPFESIVPFPTDPGTAVCWRGKNLRLQRLTERLLQRGV